MMDANSSHQDVTDNDIVSMPGGHELSIRVVSMLCDFVKRYEAKWVVHGYDSLPIKYCLSGLSGSGPVAYFTYSDNGWMDIDVNDVKFGYCGRLSIGDDPTVAVQDRIEKFLECMGFKIREESKS